LQAVYGTQTPGENSLIADTSKRAHVTCCKLPTVIPLAFPPNPSYHTKTSPNRPNDTDLGDTNPFPSRTIRKRFGKNSQTSGTATTATSNGHGADHFLRFLARSGEIDTCIDITAEISTYDYCSKASLSTLSITTQRLRSNQSQQIPAINLLCQCISLLFHDSHLRNTEFLPIHPLCSERYQSPLYIQNSNQSQKTPANLLYKCMYLCFHDSHHNNAISSSTMFPNFALNYAYRHSTSEFQAKPAYTCQSTRPNVHITSSMVHEAPSETH
jgi:hypothetical protein